MSVHELKTQTRWLDRVLTGEKRAEIRKHDRDFQVGDILHLVEVDTCGHRVWTSGGRDSRGRFVAEHQRHADVRVTHVLLGAHAAGIDSDHCLLSIELVEGGAA